VIEGVVGGGRGCLEVVEGGWRWSEVVEGGWRWLKVVEGGRRWLEVVEGGRSWLEVDGGGWRWMEVVEGGRMWSATSELRQERRCFHQKCRVSATITKLSILKCERARPAWLHTSPISFLFLALDRNYFWGVGVIRLPID